jgi:hypothetical protein
MTSLPQNGVIGNNEIELAEKPTLRELGDLEGADLRFPDLFLQSSLPIQYHCVRLRSTVLERHRGRRHEKSAVVRRAIPNSARSSLHRYSEELRLLGPCDGKPAQMRLLAIHSPLPTSTHR